MVGDAEICCSNSRMFASLLSFPFIFADEEKTSIVSSTNRSYSCAVLEPWESLNCLSKAFTGAESSLQIYTIKKRKG